MSDEPAPAAAQSKIAAPTPEAKQFVNYVLGFGVGQRQVYGQAYPLLVRNGFQRAADVGDGEAMDFGGSRD